MVESRLWGYTPLESLNAHLNCNIYNFNLKINKQHQTYNTHIDVSRVIDIAPLHQLLSGVME